MTLLQRLRRKTIFILDKIRDSLENENNCNMQTNGEAHFLRALNIFYRGEMIVVDVGSASGEYSAFIPSATVYSFDGRQNYVISDSDGVRTFYVRTRTPELSSVNRLEYLDSKYGPVEKIEMPTKSLKTVIKENSIKHISLLKIDTEGHEMHVLKGLEEYLRADFIDFVQFERGNAEADSRLKTLYELFNEKGFDVRKIYRNSVERLPYMSQNENLNYSNYVAVSKCIDY
jgi:hypothetical protein